MKFSTAENDVLTNDDCNLIKEGQARATKNWHSKRTQKLNTRTETKTKTKGKKSITKKPLIAKVRKVRIRRTVE